MRERLPHPGSEQSLELRFRFCGGGVSSTGAFGVSVVGMLSFMATGGGVISIALGIVVGTTGCLMGEETTVTMGLIGREARIDG